LGKHQKNRDLKGVFNEKWGCHFVLELGGHFKLELGGQYS